MTAKHSIIYSDRFQGPSKRKKKNPNLVLAYKRTMQMKTNSISQFNHTCEIFDISDPNLRASERGRSDSSNSSCALSSQ